MILADKIIRLRKKNGWSQEELAEKNECVQTGGFKMGRSSIHTRH